MEEQRYWSREDTGITEFLVDIAKIRLGNYLVILAKMVALVYLIFARGLRSFILRSLSNHDDDDAGYDAK